MQNNGQENYNHPVVTATGIEQGHYKPVCKGKLPKVYLALFIK